ncbi:MAG: hypothetical protein JST11_11815, partial [Acidobacteria bacterium]|nr:hypothetical protein [Acidobacteriota bacterium]
APFRDPMRLDRLPIELTEGGNRYRLEANGDGGFRMDMFSGAERVVGYLAHDPPRPREFFAPVVEGSYALTSTFLRSLRISRVWDGYSLDLIDRKLFRHEAGRTSVRPLESLAELAAAVRGDLCMPRCPIESAVEILEELTGKPLF